ncbi:MAG: glycosyltransferase family 2 protein [Algicola sp.]|nr:glycosyltransferase family 2 protein [Algicola sp.]
MKIAIVILNWNGQQLLEQFLPSVVTHSAEADIYVADNASTDDSLGFIQKNFPEVRCIRNNENGGYAKGYNDALKHVDADVFCLLNSDVEVTSDWLNAIKKEYTTCPNTAIIQPKILDFKNKTHFEYAGAAGGFVDKYGYAYCRGRIFDTIEADHGQYNATAPIFWASGACFFITKSVFEKLGGFDERYFAHYEEIDLCWRAFNEGFITKSVGQSSVYHLGGATLNNMHPKKTFLNFRNSLFTLTKNAKGPLFQLIVTRLILDGIAGLQFLWQFKFSHFIAILRAHFSFYSHLTYLLKQRKGLLQRDNYYKTTSIVWAYFIKKRKTFNC